MIIKHHLETCFELFYKCRLRRLHSNKSFPPNELRLLIYILFKIASLSASVIRFIQHILATLQNCLNQSFLNPSFHTPLCVYLSYFFSGLPSHINSYIIFSILFTL